ncbi:hypothetical protein, partial [Enterobacter hormaechei]|uniref:hypothetical protein n=1 Tax=Enterobacter hormaechei TaxID=158836 RepID=UPI0013E02055
MALKLVGGGYLHCSLKTTYRSKKPAKNLKMPGFYFVDRRLERIKEADKETYVEQHEMAVARYCDLTSKLGHSEGRGSLLTCGDVEENPGPMENMENDENIVVGPKPFYPIEEGSAGTQLRKYMERYAKLGAIAFT